MQLAVYAPRVRVSESPLKRQGTRQARRQAHVHLPSACACAPTILKLMQTSRYPAVSFDSYAGESLFFTRSMTTLASSAIVRKQRMRSCRDLKTMLVRVRSSSLEMSFCAIVKAHFQLATSPTGREHKQTEKIVVVGETLQHTL